MGWCMASSALFARGNKEARGVCQIALSRGTRTCTSGICLREAEELNLDFGAVLFHGRSAPESGLKNPEWNLFKLTRARFSSGCNSGAAGGGWRGDPGKREPHRKTF